MMKDIKQYMTYSEGLLLDEDAKNIPAFLKKYNLDGMEVYMNEAHTRTESLFNSCQEKQKLVEKYSDLMVKRIHCSYWASPTSFLAKNNFKELVEHFGNTDEIIKYYGDLLGAHMYERWAQEYELATELGAQAYVFHVIDYSSIDGVWDFSITREEILQAMIGMVQMFILYLEEKNLLNEDSPIIELENAGWGLEYGIQKGEDFKALFEQLYDPADKVRVGWDINHLLHAIGWTENKDGAYFMLQDFEITPEMLDIQERYGKNPKQFAMKWIESNLLHPTVVNKTNSLHLSDCALKEEEYFRNGRLLSIYGEKIDSMVTREEKSDYGLGIVLDKYDSHIPMGKGVLLVDEMKNLIRELQKRNDTFVLLHELKNSTNIYDDLEDQLAFLVE